MPIDSTNPDASDNSLEITDLDGVSGGLNPQPLPPLDGGGDVHVNPGSIPKLTR